MLILNIISSISPKSGGPGQGIRNLSPELHNLGWRNEVVCLDDPSEEFLGQDVFPVHTLGPSRTSWAYSSRLRPWLRENLARFDHVMVRGLWQYHAFAARQECLRAGKLYAIMPHGMLDPWFQRDPSRRFKALRNKIYWRLIERQTVRSASALLFTCEEELRLARTSFPDYRPQREINVGYGIQAPPAETVNHASAFHAQCPKLGNRAYLLFLSRIHPKKGVDLLIRAYIETAQKRSSGANMPPLPALVIAGPLDSSYARAMQALAASLLASSPLVSSPAAAPAIHFPGMLQGEAKWGAFYGCEAFILPSHQENFGIAVAEALACGKPVFITDQINIWREIVTDGGGCARPDTAEGIMALLNDALCPETVARCQRAARKVFETHFTVTNAAQSLVDALSNLK